MAQEGWHYYYICYSNSRVILMYLCSSLCTSAQLTSDLFISHNKMSVLSNNNNNDNNNTTLHLRQSKSRRRSWATWSVCRLRSWRKSRLAFILWGLFFRPAVLTGTFQSFQNKVIWCKCCRHWALLTTVTLCLRGRVQRVCCLTLSSTWRNEF